MMQIIIVGGVVVVVVVMAFSIGQWRSQEFAAGYARHKKIEANTQYNGQLSYHGHNKSIIINSASLLHAGGGALALGWRGAYGLPRRSCRC